MLTPKQIEDARKQLGIHPENPSIPTGSNLIQRLEQQSNSQDSTFGQRLVEGYKAGGQKVINAVEKGASKLNDPNKNLLQKAGSILETGLNTAGAVAGTAFTPVTAAIEPALKPVIEKIVSIPGVSDKVQEISEWAKANPDAATSLQSVFDLATLPVGGVAEKAAKNTAIKTGQKIGKAGTNIKTGVGDVLEKTGQKIQNTVIKPSVRDVKDGFKIENMSKYDVGGSLPETIAKTHTKMNQLSQELTAKLKSTDAKLDLKKVYSDTIKSMGGDKALSFGDNKAIERVLNNLDEEIKQISPDGSVDLVKATNVKRGAGSKGAWAYNRPEADSSAIEKVYTAFYNNLKKEIETVAPDGIKDINKQISELIPINNAALRRMTVEERNNALSLMDNIGLVSSVFDPKALLLFGTNRALKSGKVGKFLTETGQKLKGTKNPSPKVSPK